MKKHIVELLILIFSLLSSELKSQESDFGIRFGSELSKKISKKIELQLEEELRLNQNVSTFDRSMTTLSGSYAFNKKIKAGLYYTYIYMNNQNDGYYESRNRFGGWLQASQKVNRLNFTLKEKFQNTYRDESLGNFKYNPKMYLRSKMEISYNIKKMPLKPYLSAEMYYQLNNPDGNVTDKWKYTIGTQWDINKKFGLDMYYLFDKEQNVKNPVTTSVIGTTLKYKF